MKSNLVPINTYVDGMVWIIVGPPPEQPIAEFTPSQGVQFKAEDEITLDGSTSTFGIDILPSPGNLCPITEWRWDIDIGDDGSTDLTSMVRSSHLLRTIHVP
jgi:hypothetical protein